MRTALFRAFGGEITVALVPDPVPSPDGVVIKVEANGICRSDWHGWMGHDPDISLPHVPGHELAGTVAETGANVTGWRSGDRVTLLNDALAADPVVVRVPGGVDVDGPIVVVNRAATPDGMSFPRLVVDAGADSAVTIVEIQVGGSGALVVPVTEVAVGPACRRDRRAPVPRRSARRAGRRRGAAGAGHRRR